MKLSALIYADKIGTPTDKRLTALSLCSAALSIALFTALLVLCISLSVPIILLYVLIAAVGSAAFVVSLIYTVALLLRKRSLFLFISVVLLIITVALAMLAIILA